METKTICIFAIRTPLYISGLLGTHVGAIWSDSLGRGPSNPDQVPILIKSFKIGPMWGTVLN